MTARVDELLQKAGEEIAALRFADAENLLQEALKIDGGNADAAALLARLQIARGELQGASENLDAALANNPNHALSLALKGALLNIQRQYAAALPWLHKAIAVDPRLDVAYVNLGIAERKLGMLKQSEKWLRRAIEISPQNYEARYCLGYTLCLQKRIAEGIHETMEAIKANPLFLPAYLVLGAMYRRAGKMELVERLYQEGLRYNPKALPLRRKLYELYFDTKQFEKAEEQIIRVTEQSHAAGDYMLAGRTHLVTGKIDRAEKAFRKAAEIKPQAWQPHFNLGELYSVMKVHDRAEEQYQSAIELNGNSYKPYNGLGLMKLQESKFEEAISLLRRATEIAPRAAIPAYNLALAYAKTGKKQPALFLLNRVLVFSKSPTITRSARKLVDSLSKQS